MHAAVRRLGGHGSAISVKSMRGPASVAYLPDQVMTCSLHYNRIQHRNSLRSPIYSAPSQVTAIKHRCELYEEHVAGKLGGFREVHNNAEFGKFA